MGLDFHGGSIIIDRVSRLIPGKFLRGILALARPTQVPLHHTESQDDRLRSAAKEPGVCALDDEETALTSISLSRHIVKLRSPRSNHIPLNWKSRDDTEGEHRSYHWLPVVLSRVCRQWRILTLSTSCLWSGIIFSNASLVVAVEHFMYHARISVIDVFGHGINDHKLTQWPPALVNNSECLPRRRIVPIATSGPSPILTLLQPLHKRVAFWAHRKMTWRSSQFESSLILLFAKYLSCSESLAMNTVPARVRFDDRGEINASIPGVMQLLSNAFSSGSQW